MKINEVSTEERRVKGRTVGIIGCNNVDKDLDLKKLLSTLKIDMIITDKKPDKELAICYIQSDSKKALDNAINNSKSLFRREKRQLKKELERIISDNNRKQHPRGQ